MFEVPSNVRTCHSETLIFAKLSFCYIDNVSSTGLLDLPSVTQLIDYGERLKRFDPQYWLPFLTLIWGIVSVAQGLVKNQAGLYAVRLRK